MVVWGIFGSFMVVVVEDRHGVGDARRARRVVSRARIDIVAVIFWFECAMK